MLIFIIRGASTARHTHCFEYAARNSADQEVIAQRGQTQALSLF